jgi:hypothetical protein
MEFPDMRRQYDLAWAKFFRFGAITAWITIAVMVSEIVITMLPGGGRVAPEDVTVVTWFELFQDSWFLGLRNLGLINLLATALLLPTSLAMYGALRKEREPWALLALVISAVAAAVYFAGYTGFAMFNLSQQYAVAATESERLALEIAGRGLLALGESHTPGTFLPFLLFEAGGVFFSVLMLRSPSFARVTAIAGLIGNGGLLLFEFISDFVPALFEISIFVALAGGIMSMVWYALTARDLLRLERRITASARA